MGGVARWPVAAELIARARAGDAAAFRALTEPHRPELRAHCYRMLGSLQDAEDALQETLLAAWQGLHQYEARASIRTWLYAIATHRCLNARRAARRRPARAFDVPGVQPPPPTRLGEVTWLEPFPDALLADVPAASPGPEARYAQAESIALGFVTALQRLPHRQLAVLLLCDVVGLDAREVGSLLGTTVDAVNGALKRARATLQRDRAALRAAREAPAPDSPAEAALVGRFARAWEAADVDAVVALLTDDVFVSMPPFPNEYVGREIAARFCASLFDAGRRFELVPTSANRQPAFGVYLRTADGARRGVGLYVLALRGARICAMTRFEHHVLPWFGLPASLPGA